MTMKELMRQCDEYIAAHLDENLTRDILAERIGYSRSQFSRLFPQHHGGLRLRQYLLKQRVEKAASLLRKDPSLPIRELVRETGLGSHSTILRAFHDEFGMSVRSFREQQKKDLQAGPTAP